MEYKLSVIIPAFNAETYITRCLESIFAQSIESKEIIVVDDGSEDSTLCILESYKSKLDDFNKSNFKIINKSNGGPSSARNTGLNVASGEYIAFVDSDDYIEPDMYENLICIAENESLDLVLCNILNHYPDGGIHPSEEKAPANRILTKKEIVELICPTLMREDVFGGPCNRIYRKAFIEKIGARMPENIDYGEDAVFQMQVFDNVDKTWFDSHCYYHYIHRDGSQSHAQIGRFKKTLLPLYIIRKRYGDKWGIDEKKINNYFIYCTAMDFITTLKNKEYKTKREYLRDIFRNEHLYNSLKNCSININTYTFTIWFVYRLFKHFVRKR